MPIYEPDHVEYDIASGHIQVVLDDGTQFPAYLANPHMGTKFPGVALIHDWWGLNDIVRRMANLFAMMGYYVICPDLFEGHTARTPQQAKALVESLGEDYGFSKVHSALSVLETHSQTNGDVAAIGIGLGGSLAFEAAIVREDLEAAVAYGGFPQRYFGRFKQANTPILAFYGAQEPHITPQMIGKLRGELAQNPIGHHVEIVDAIGHEFFTEDLTPEQRSRSRMVLKATLDFLDPILASAKKTQPRQVY